MSAPALAIEAASPRTWWTCEVITSEYGTAERRRQVKNPEDALLVGSLTKYGHHMPALDLDIPVETRQFPGGTLLRFPGLVNRPWRRKRLIRYLSEICFVSSTFVEHAWTGEYDDSLYIEFIVPVRVIPSSSPGHYHLYIDAQLSWNAYRTLCKRMRSAGLLEDGYVEVSLRDRMTMLLKPGLDKKQLIAEGRMLSGRR